MSLQDIFYTLGIIVAVLNIVFLIAVSVGAWYAYKFYTAAKSKVMNNSALFMAHKIMSNPMKFSGGMMVMQLIGKLMQALRGRKRARVT